MKEIWAYIKWQHRIPESGIVFLVMYGMLGYISSDLEKMTSTFEKIALLVITFILLLFHFRSFWDKKVIREEKLIPINRDKKILGIIIYIMLVFLPGLAVSYLCTNEYILSTILILLSVYIIVIGIKSGKKPLWFRLMLEIIDKKD